MPIASFLLRFSSPAMASTHVPRAIAGAFAPLAPIPRSRSRDHGALLRAVLAGVTGLLLVSMPAFAQSTSSAGAPDGASGGPASVSEAGASARSPASAMPSNMPSDMPSDMPAPPVAAASDPIASGAPLSDEEYTARARGHDALQKTLDERTAQMNYAYAVKQHNCYARFFVNHCLEVARDAMREEKGRIRTEQLALSAERRSDRARQRDTRAEAKRVQTAADAPQRAANEERNRAAFAAKQQQHDIDVARRGNDAAEQRQRAANAAAYQQKQAAHQQALDQANRNAEADAAKRAENVRRYQQKQSDAADRQRDLDARRRKAEERAKQSAPPASAPAAQARP